MEFQDSTERNLLESNMDPFSLANETVLIWPMWMHEVNQAVVPVLVWDFIHHANPREIVIQAADTGLFRYRDRAASFPISMSSLSDIGTSSVSLAYMCPQHVHMQSWFGDGDGLWNWRVPFTVLANSKLTSFQFSFWPSYIIWPRHIEELDTMDVLINCRNWELHQMLVFDHCMVVAN